MIYTILFSSGSHKKIGHELINFFPAVTLILQFSNFKAPVIHTEFTRNNEPGGIENATRNSSGEKPGHLPLRCPAFCCNVLWVAFDIPPGSLFLVNHPVLGKSTTSELSDVLSANFLVKLSHNYE
jgi:hypothetical protein